MSHVRVRLFGILSCGFDCEPDATLISVCKVYKASERGGRDQARRHVAADTEDAAVGCR